MGRGRLIVAGALAMWLLDQIIGRAGAIGYLRGREDSLRFQMAIAANLR